MCERQRRGWGDDERMRAREWKERERERDKQFVLMVGRTYACMCSDALTRACVVTHLRVQCTNSANGIAIVFLGVLPNSISTSWPVKFSVNNHGRNPVCPTCFQQIL